MVTALPSSSWKKSGSKTPNSPTVHQTATLLTVKRSLVKFMGISSCPISEILLINITSSMKMLFVTGQENSGRGHVRKNTLAAVHTILPVLFMKFLHSCQLVGIKFKIQMQNASYHNVRQSQSNSMFAS